MIWENKNAFFDIEILSQNMTKDVISLDISEEITKTDDVSITLNDPLLTYDNLLPFGKEVSIKWGVHGLPGITRFNKGFVTASNNSADNKGHITTQITLQTILDINTVQIIHTGTRKQIVDAVFLSMGISQTVVNFISMGTFEEQITQRENDFNFLVRLSREWSCHFKIGHNQAKNPVAAFCSAEKLAEFVTWIGGTGIILYYGFTGNALKLPNVVSYTKSRNPVGSGGQSAMITLGSDGQPVLTRLVTEKDSVTTWKLDTKKCAEAVKKLVDDPEGLKKFWENYLSPNVGWETAKQFYIMVSQDTASESMGYTISCELIGSPSVSSGSMVYFREGFSDDLGVTNRTWWIRKVKHSFSNQGYKTSIEVVDSRQMSDAGAQIPAIMEYILEEAKAQ